MALIKCSKCSRHISSFAKACPACGTSPRISTVPPPLPQAKGAIPYIFKVALVIAFALDAVSLYNVVQTPKSRTTSAPSWAAPIPAATPQYFPRTSQQFPRAPQYFPRTPQYLPRAAQQFPRAIPVQTPTPFGADVSRATPAPVTYRVVKILQGDYLNVRTGAGSTYPVFMRLAPGTDGIVLGANRVANDETMWQEIIVNGRTGWVNADYIAPATQSFASP
jgi:uncharacterized protein YgiM (DUF1202 family)